MRKPRAKRPKPNNIQNRKEAGFTMEAGFNINPKIANKDKQTEFTLKS